MKTKNTVFVYLMGVVFGLDVALWIVWWIWGLVILITNENNSCVAEGKGMAVMAIINLLIGECRFLYLQTIAGVFKQ